MADNGTHEIAFVLSTQGGEKVVQTFQQINVQYNQLTQQNNVLIQQQNKVNMSQRQSINNTNNFVKAEKNVGKEASALSSMFSGLGKIIAVAFSLNAIKNFTQSCLELGSALTEVQNVVDVVFGKNNNYIEDFAQSSLKQFGLMEVAAKRYAGLFGSMAKNSGLSDEQSEAMATQLAGMVGDVASFYDIDKEQAYTSLMSIFSGNVASLRRNTGIVATQGNLQEYASQNGIDKQIKDMTQAEKVALRYSFVMEKLAFAQGDFQRTSGTWANQMRLLNGEWEQFKTNLGQILIEFLLPLLQGLNKLIQLLVDASAKLKEFVFTFRGMSDSGVSEEAAKARAAAAIAADTMDDYADSIDGVSASAEKLKKASFGFDNLNKLADTKSGSGGAGSKSPLVLDGLLGDTNPFQDTTPIKEVEIRVKPSGLDDFYQTLKNIWQLFIDIGGVIKKIGLIIYEVFTSAIVQTFIDNIDTIKGYFQDVKDVFDAFVKLFDGWVQRTSEKLDVFQQRDLPGIIKEIKDDLQEAFDLFKDFWDSYIKPKFDRMTEKLKEMFGEGGTWDECVDKLLTAFEVLGKNSGWLMDIIAGLLGAIINAFATIGEMALTFLEGQMEELTGFVEFFAGIFEMIEGIFDGSTEKISDGFKLMLQGLLDYLVNGILKQMLGYIEDFINSALDLVGADPIDLTSKIKAPTIYEPKTYSNNHSAYMGLNAAKNTGSTSPIVIQNYTTLDGKVVAQSVNTVNNRNSNVLGSMNNGSSSGYQWRPAP
jgi:hypothetical protein